VVLGLLLRCIPLADVTQVLDQLLTQTAKLNVTGTVEPRQSREPSLAEPAGWGTAAATPPAL
jgi:hypothetical protein